MGGERCAGSMRGGGSAALGSGSAGCGWILVDMAEACRAQGSGEANGTAHFTRADTTCDVRRWWHGRRRAGRGGAGRGGVGRRGVGRRGAALGRTWRTWASFRTKEG
eukprot:scaffold7963_cov61-Phaeocystis_antarctica.AAC.4